MRTSSRPLASAKTLGVSALLAAGLAAAGFGTVRAGQPGAAAPATTVAGPTTTAAGPTTTAGTTAPAAEGTVLPANATLDQIRSAALGVAGPTTDLMAELAPFVNAVPPGFPTPEGADVREFSIYYYPNSGGSSDPYYSMTMLFTTSVPAPDLVTFFQSAMPAAGFVQTGDSVQNEDDRQIRRLTYDLPAPTTDIDEIKVIVVDESDPTETDFVQLEAFYGLDPAIVQMFAGWPTGIPLIGELPVEEASINMHQFFDITINLSNRYTVPVPYADAFTQFEAGLEGTGYTIDPDSDPTEGYFDVFAGELGELTVFLNEGLDETTTRLSIDGSFDIVE